MMLLGFAGLGFAGYRRASGTNLTLGTRPSAGQTAGIDPKRNFMLSPEDTVYAGNPPNGGIPGSAVSDDPGAE
jgi:hypothetical protein